MSPAQNRPIEIDARGIVWAYNLGASHRALALYAPKVLITQWCPFREGTPHFRHWKAGWFAHKAGDYKKAYVR